MTQQNDPKYQERQSGNLVPPTSCIECPGNGDELEAGACLYHQLFPPLSYQGAAMLFLTCVCFLPGTLWPMQWPPRVTALSTLVWRHSCIGNLSKCLPERGEILATEAFQGLDKFETQRFFNLRSQPIRGPVSLQVSAIFLEVSEEIEWRITSRCHCSRPVTISEMIVSASTHICNWLPKPYDSLSQLIWWNIGVKSLWMRRSQAHLLFTPLPASFSPSSANCPPRAHYGNQPECMYRNQSRRGPS